MIQGGHALIARVLGYEQKDIDIICAGINHTSQISSVMTVNPFNNLSCFIKTQMGYWMYNPAVGLSNIVTQPILLIANENEVKPHTVCHPGEEYIFIFEGEMHFSVGNQTYFLRRGDSLFFDGLQPHGIRSVDGQVQYIDVLVSYSDNDSDRAQQIQRLTEQSKE